MGNIQWGEIKVAIEKVEDPNVLNIVLEHYHKAEMKHDLFIQDWKKIKEMQRERRFFNHEEEYTILEEQYNKLSKKEDEEKDFKKKCEIEKETNYLFRKMYAISKESSKRWDEIYGEEFDMIHERGRTRLQDAIPYWKNAKRALTELGISNDKTKELERHILIRLAWEESVLEVHWDTLYAKEIFE